MSSSPAPVAARRVRTVRPAPTCRRSGREEAGDAESATIHPTAAARCPPSSRPAARTGIATGGGSPARRGRRETGACLRRRAAGNRRAPMSRQRAAEARSPGLLSPSWGAFHRGCRSCLSQPPISRGKTSLSPGRGERGRTARPAGEAGTAFRGEFAHRPGASPAPAVRVDKARSGLGPALGRPPRAHLLPRTCAPSSLCLPAPDATHAYIYAYIYI